MDARELVSRALSWPALFDRLRAEAPPEVLSSAAETAEGLPSGYWIDGPHAVLAALIASRPASLWRVVWRAAPELDRGAQTDAVCEWLSEVAHAVLFRLPRFADVVDVATETTGPAPAPGGLHLTHPALRSLPLLPFAASVAQIQPCGLLTVTTGAIAGVDGCYGRRVDCGLIVLDLNAPVPTIESTFAHEVAHATDPALADASFIAERYAQHLGPVLLEKRPETLDEAAPLIAVSRAHAGIPVPASREDRFTDLFVFLSAPLSAPLLASGAEAPGSQVHALEKVHLRPATAAAVNGAGGRPEGGPPASTPRPDPEGER